MLYYCILFLLFFLVWSHYLFTMDCRWAAIDIFLWNFIHFFLRLVNSFLFDKIEQVVNFVIYGIDVTHPHLQLLPPRCLSFVHYVHTCLIALFPDASIQVWNWSCVVSRPCLTQIVFVTPFRTIVSRVSFRLRSFGISIGGRKFIYFLSGKLIPFFIFSCLLSCIQVAVLSCLELIS